MFGAIKAAPVIVISFAFPVKRCSYNHRGAVDKSLLTHDFTPSIQLQKHSIIIILLQKYKVNITPSKTRILRGNKMAEKWHRNADDKEIKV